MFGNPITDGSQVAVGTNGYIVGFDLSGYKIREAYQIQLQNGSSVLSDTITEKVTEDVLFDYPETDNPPDIAFSQSGTIVYVFLKSSVYSFVNTNRIAIWFYRNANEITDISSFVDIPDGALDLLLFEIQNDAYLLADEKPPFSVTNGIRKEMKRLGY